MTAGAGLLAGKRGLVLGVANKMSIAWGIARACAAQGAELAFTYQGEALEKRVRRSRPKSRGAGAGPHGRHRSRATIDAVFAEAARVFGTIDFVVHAIAFADKDELTGRYVDTSEAKLHPRRC